MRHRQRSRQACKALLWGLLIFAVLEAGLTLVAEFWFPQLRDPYYVYKVARLRQRIEHAGPPAAPDGPRPKVVVLVGSSRAADGLRGTLAEADLGRVLRRPVVLFNLGVPGDTPINELLNLERLLEDGIRPDLLLVEVVPYMLSAVAAEQLDRMPAERLGLRDRAVLKRRGLPVARLGRYSWLCWGVPSYSHRLEILSVLVPEALPHYLRDDQARSCDDAGWIVPNYDPSPEAQDHALRNATGGYRKALRYFELGNPLCPALGVLLQRCHEEHIPAALLLMPEGTHFQRLYGAHAWERIQAFLRELAGPYGTPIINAHDWIADDGFWDSHHLLPDGAAAFTARLAREHLAPLLRDTPEVPGEDTPRRPKLPRGTRQHAGL